MNELTVSNATAEDRLEILDNGIHREWADVVEGKWTCPNLNLTVGNHNLTAKYKGKEAVWNVVVEEQNDIENFEDAPVGEIIRSLSRHYYTGTLTVIGTPPPPRDGSRPASIAHTGYPGMSGKWLRLGCARQTRPDWYYNYNTEYVMAFKDVYSSVSFVYTVILGWDMTADAKVEILNNQGGVIQSVPLPYVDGRTVSLGSAGQSNIKSIKFSSMVRGSGNVWLLLAVDNMTFRK